MGASPFGGDGACFAVASLGGAHQWGLAAPPVVAMPLGAPGRARVGGGAPRKTFVLRGAARGAGAPPLLRPIGGGAWALLEGGGAVRVVAGVSAGGAWREAGVCTRLRGGGGGEEAHECALFSGGSLSVRIVTI
jgi:hypothetical protein